MDHMDGSPSGAPSCNLDYLLLSLGRNRETALRLVGLFLDSYPHLVRRLDEAVADGNLERLQQVVHDIRGNCVLFSAQECLEITVRMERSLRQPIGDHPSASVAAGWASESALLRRALDRVVVELRDYRAAAAP
jgi:HPt (histidine-containing phosphotransfer) domain-containing protein